MRLRIEEASLSGWPSLQTICYDGWILRFAEGYTKRSNSVNPLYRSSLGIDDKLEACESFYAARGLPSIFKLAGLEGQAEIDEALTARSYARIDETVVRTLDLGEVIRGPVPGIRIEERFEADWIEGFCECGGKPESRGVVTRILGNLLGPVVVASAREEGRIVACGYGALDRGLVGLFDIVVREDRRGRGLGESLVRAILAGARGLGAEKAYLQVVAGNAPAERLYDKIGFREAYRYWYRYAGGGSAFARS